MKVCATVAAADVVGPCSQFAQEGHHHHHQQYQQHVTGVWNVEFDAVCCWYCARRQSAVHHTPAAAAAGGVDVASVILARPALPTVSVVVILRTQSSSSRARFTKYLTIYHNIILSLS